MGRGIEQLTVLKVDLGEIQPNVFYVHLTSYIYLAQTIYVCKLNYVITTTDIQYVPLSM